MPETIGFFIAENLLALTGVEEIATFAEASFLGISGASVIGTAAILGATIGLSYALRPDVPTPESGSQALKQSVPPRIRGYGLNRLAGYYMLFEAAGAAPNTSYDMEAFHSGRVGAVRQLYLDDDPVSTTPPLTATGAGVYTIATTYGDGRYGGGRVQVEIALGSVPQAASLLLSNPEISPIWTSAFRGHGIAWAALVCGSVPEPADFTKIYPRGHPSLSQLAECSPVWDPRVSAQSRFNEATWTVSHNPVIQLIDYLTRVDGGMGLDLDTILPPATLAQWMIEADICDALVPNANDAQEPRYSCSGWFEYVNAPDGVIGNILATCDGWLAESGEGDLSLTVGLYRAPTIEPLTEKDIMGFALAYGTADEEQINQLDITFTDPSAKYVTVQTEPWRDEEAISLAGIVRAQGLSLPWVQSHSQARRLADRAMQRLNPSLTGSFTTDLIGLYYLGMRWVPLQYPFVSGLQDCVVEIQGAEVDLLGGRITWTFIRIGDDIEAYTPATDEGAAPVTPPTIAEFVVFDFSKPAQSGYLALLEDI